MERVLPLVAKYGAAVVAISNDETGISMDPDVRFAVAKRIVERAADYGIPASRRRRRPAGDADRRAGQAGQQVFQLIRRLRDELKVNTTCGASNVSFGLPNRQQVTGTFLAMAIGAGMTSAIMNPMHPEVKAAVMAADVLAGNDKDCAAWIRANRGADGSVRRARGAAPPSQRVAPDAPNRLHSVRPDGEVDTGTTVLTAARQLGVDLDSVCGGRGICGRCQIEPSTGTFAKWAIDSEATALSDWSAVEVDYETKGKPGVRSARVAASAARQPCSTTWSSTCRPRARCTGRSCASPRPHRSGHRSAVHAVQRRGAQGGARRLRIGDRADRRGRRSNARRRCAHVEHHGACAARTGPPPTITGRSRSLSTATALPWPSGRASSTPRSASPSTSAPRPSPATCATCRPARCWPPPG